MCLTFQVYFFVSLLVDSPSVNGEMCGNSCQEKCFHILQAERRIIALLSSGVSFLFNLTFSQDCMEILFLHFVNFR